MPETTVSAEDALEFANARLPWLRAQMRRKSSSWTQRLIGKVIGPLTGGRYMTDYWTTIGGTIYRPDDVSSDEWETVFHELTHVVQARRRGGTLWHSLLYLMPQVLFLPALVTLLVLYLAGALGPWWMASSLVCLAPWPSYWRMWRECEGYSLGLVLQELRQDDLGMYLLGWATDHFTGPSYYFMWPFEEKMRNRLYQKLFLLDRSSDGVSFLNSLPVGNLRAIYSVAYDYMRLRGLLSPRWS